MKKVFNYLAAILIIGGMFVLALMSCAYIIVLVVAFINWDFSIITLSFHHIEWKNIRLLYVLGCFIGFVIVSVQEDY